MYTRSFPSRRMPPDYGGTALVIGPQHQDEPRAAITDPTADRRIRRHGEKPDPKTTFDVFPPPLGIFGQENADVDEAQSAYEPEEVTPRIESPASLMSLDRLKSDDLLLLGLALLLFTDKDGEDGISTDALLILAILFFSGL